MRPNWRCLAFTGPENIAVIESTMNSCVFFCMYSLSQMRGHLSDSETGPCSRIIIPSTATNLQQKKAEKGENQGTIKSKPQLDWYAVVGPELCRDESLRTLKCGPRFFRQRRETRMESYRKWFVPAIGIIIVIVCNHDVFYRLLWHFGSGFI